MECVLVYFTMFIARRSTWRRISGLLVNSELETKWKQAAVDWALQIATHVDIGKDFVISLGVLC
jgi:hypothetical protein